MGWGAGRGDCAGISLSYIAPGPPAIAAEARAARLAGPVLVCHPSEAPSSGHCHTRLPPCAHYNTATNSNRITHTNSHEWGTEKNTNKYYRGRCGLWVGWDVSCHGAGLGGSGLSNSMYHKQGVWLRICDVFDAEAIDAGGQLCRRSTMLEVIDAGGH